MYVCECSAAQSCLTLWDPMDCSPLGCSVHGIFQAKTLEWVTISYFRVYFRPRDGTQVSCIAGRFFTVWATREVLSRQNISSCGVSDGKESTCNVRDLGSIPGLGRSPGEGKSYPLQYSGLENGVTKSQIQLSDFHFFIFFSIILCLFCHYGIFDL